MPSIRQDAWSHAEDLKLAEIILRLIREGETQLTGFAEAGKALSRTAAACGFRWNSTIRKQYETEMTEAKDARKALKTERKKGPLKLVTTGADEGSSDFSIPVIDQLINFLNHLKSGQLTDQTADTLKQIESLKNENSLLEEAYRKLEKEYRDLKRNYTSLLRVLNLVDQARKQIPVDRATVSAGGQTEEA